MLRWLVRQVFPPVFPREKRLRRWAGNYKMQLIQVGFDSYALTCGMFRFPSGGGEPLDIIENYLHGLKHGLFRPWR